jgi:N-methylhydantoinase B/oxoprolinase/acetone carboxylase alpha subunit
MWSRLMAIADEMWTTVLRTAVSSVIGAAQDFGCEILDAQGNGLAHAARSMPVFNLVMPVVTRAMLSRFPVETMRPGDVYVTNDPWICAGHLDDITTVTPVFRNGRVAGFASTVAHATSIGGMLDRVQARDRLEEGIFIPPDYLYREGEPNQTLFNILEANVRSPEMVMTDVAAQVAANDVGVRRVLAFLDEYELDNLAELAAVVQQRSEQAMRRAIAAVPDGVYRNEEAVETPSGDVFLKAAITIDGEEVWVDYAGSAPEQPVGGINCTFTYTKAHTVYPLKCLLTPSIPSNEGCFKPMHISAPEGCILNAGPHASVGARTKTGWHSHGLIFGALAKAMPDRVQAGNGLMHALYAAGREGNGEPFTMYFFTGGGRGAGGGKPGLGYNCFPSSAGNIPVEVFESRVPILVEERSIMQGSGGSGTLSGTPGHRFRLKRLPGSNADVRLYLHPDRLRHPAPGLFGGGPGNRTRVLLNDHDITNGTGLLTNGEVILATDDDVYTSETAGGGGIGYTA